MIDDPYPEHTKQRAVLHDAEIIGQFIEGTQYVLAEYVQFDGYFEPSLVPVSKSIEQVLAAYFGIDLDKIEAEKRAMLAAARSANDEDDEHQALMDLQREAAGPQEEPDPSWDDPDEHA
jgi:hypothetical protein